MIQTPSPLTILLVIAMTLYLLTKDLLIPLTKRLLPKNGSNRGNNPHPCESHRSKLEEDGKAIARLETKVGELDENNERGHTRIFNNIDRIFLLIDSIKK